MKLPEATPMKGGAMYVRSRYIRVTNANTTVIMLSNFNTGFRLIKGNKL